MKTANVIYRIVRCLVAALCLCIGTPLRGQDAEARKWPLTITLNLGGSGLLQPEVRCEGNLNVLGGVEAQTRGAVFVSAGFGQFSEPPRDDCASVPTVTILPDGSARVAREQLFIKEGSLYTTAGLGVRIWPVEVRADVGYHIRRHYKAAPDWLPAFGIHGGLAGKHVALSIGRRWIRHPAWEIVYPAEEWLGYPSSDPPVNAQTYHRWTRAKLVMVGIRLKT